MKIRLFYSLVDYQCNAYNPVIRQVCRRRLWLRSSNQGFRQRCSRPPIRRLVGLSLFLIGLLFALPTLAQPPAIDWQTTLGGSDSEAAYALTPTADGGYVVAGYTYSTDGDITAKHGDLDCWVVKLDRDGRKLWQTALGGGGEELAKSVTATTDGGYVVACYTTSTDGDIAGYHGGNTDIWIVKLDAQGRKLWRRALGGSGDEYANGITASADGGVVVAGSTSSTDGDVTVYHGGYSDFWVIKLDKSGRLVWQTTLGGSDNEEANAVTATADGGYVVAGYTDSSDGDVTVNHGLSDYWVVKLDGTGQKLWQTVLGGSGTEQASAVATTTDGSIVVAGSISLANTNYATGYHGSMDYWVIKLDASGHQLWQRALGGSSYDQAYGITATTDGGMVVAGFSMGPTDGDVTANHGESDYWVVKLDKAGQLRWQTSLGGRLRDEAYAITVSADGGVVVAGSAHSSDGDVTGHHGTYYNTDYWVVKLSGTIPDLTLGMFARPSTVYGRAPFEVVVSITELNGVSTNSPIEVHIAQDAKVSLSLESDALVVGGQAVQNSLWHLSGPSDGYYTLTTDQPITGKGVLSVGLTGELSPDATVGVLTISATVGGGSELRLTNNTDADRLDYFPKE